MKLLSILIITIALSACGMSIEKYNARIKYCKDNGMDAKAFGTINNRVVSVICIKEEMTFESKEVK